MQSTTVFEIHFQNPKIEVTQLERTLVKIEHQKGRTYEWVFLLTTLSGTVLGSPRTCTHWKGWAGWRFSFHRIPNKLLDRRTNATGRSQQCVRRTRLRAATAKASVGIEAGSEGSYLR